MRTTHQGGAGAFNDTQQMSCLAKPCSSFCASNGSTTFCPEGSEVFLAWPVNLKGKCCFSERKVLGESLPALPQPGTRAGPRAGKALQQQSHPLKLKLKLKFMNLSSFCRAQPWSGVDLWGVQEFGDPLWSIIWYKTPTQGFSVPPAGLCRNFLFHRWHGL